MLLNDMLPLKYYLLPNKRTRLVIKLTSLELFGHSIPLFHFIPPDAE